jgi:hypothetical protein
MAHARCVLQTHSEYVTLIAFPIQQQLRERALMLRLYVRCQSCDQIILQEGVRKGIQIILFNGLLTVHHSKARSESRCALRLRFRPVSTLVDITSNTFISAQRLSERRSAESVCEKN